MKGPMQQILAQAQKMQEKLQTKLEEERKEKELLK